MTTVIGVRFKSGGKIYYFDPLDMTFEEGENVIIDTSRGVEFGTCAEGNHEVPDASVVQPLHSVIRKATEEDERVAEENRKKEQRAFTICEEKILQHGLDMKLVDVEYNFEGNKILFFFTSDGRVDFRELVKDLAGVFRTRIELRQIGVRDEAKLLGGLGICGRPFCCATFIDDFQPVSIKMAKVQNLSLNPPKISGTCGRLMCCLKYEQDAYEDAAKKLPKVNSAIDTPAGKGTVADVNLLRETVTVKYEDSTEKKTYKYDSLVNGEGEEYSPAAKSTAPQFSESLLGIGFTAEEALSRMSDAGMTVPADTGSDSEDANQPAGEEKKSGNRRRHRGGRGRNRNKSGEKAPAQPGQKQGAEQRPVNEEKQKNTADNSAGGEAKKTGNRRRHRGGRGHGKGTGGQTQNKAPEATAPKSEAPAPGGAKKSGGNRNKYKGRAGNRPKNPGENKSAE